MAERRGRILVVFHEEVLGGATLSVLRLVPILEAQGWSFSFWVPAPSPLHDHLVEVGHDVGGAPRHISYSLAALRLEPGPAARIRSLIPYRRRWRTFLDQRQPQIVHANSLFTLPEALDASRRGIKTVFHVHEMVMPTNKNRMAARLIRRRIDRVIGVSESCSDALRQIGIAPTTVYEGAGMAEQEPRRSFEDGPITVGTVGVLSRRKGSDTFVDAAEIASAADPEMSFRIVGDATDPLDRDLAESVVARATELGVDYMSRASIPEFLAELDVFALPSRRDPFPISMLEAMGSGLAVIGTDVDGISEQLTPDSGLIVDPDDPEGLAEAMLRLRDPQLRRRLGSAARSRALERFGLAPQAAALGAVYGALLGYPDGDAARAD